RNKTRTYTQCLSPTELPFSVWVLLWHFYRLNLEHPIFLFSYHLKGNLLYNQSPFLHVLLCFVEIAGCSVSDIQEFYSLIYFSRVLNLETLAKSSKTLLVSDSRGGFKRGFV
ncbi:hypothetical protein F2P56_026778, partial [Juglans regia]